MFPVLGHVGLTPPGEARSPSLVQMVMAGLLKWPFLFGLTSMRRFLKFMGRWESVWKDVMQRHAIDRYYLVEEFVVSSETRSQGIGTEMLSSLLRGCVSDRTPIVLFTQTKRAVKFYLKNGFNVLEQQKFLIYDDEAPVTLWIMIKRTESAS